MRANFEIWGDEEDDLSTPSPEPLQKDVAFKNLMSAATGLFVQTGPLSMRVQPGTGPKKDSSEGMEPAEEGSSTLNSPEDENNVALRNGTLKHSESHVLQTISRTINKTHASLKRSRLIHVFYILALPLYTVFGAGIFMYLDGDYDEEAIATYDSRCNLTESLVANLQSSCGDKTVSSCLQEISEALATIDHCFRKESYQLFPTLSMKSFVNSLLFATSVYTTIGYGNVAAETLSCRIATMLYAIIGIPLFFAFLKDMGQLFSIFFIRGWHAAGRLKRRMLTRSGTNRRNSAQVPRPVPRKEVPFYRMGSSGTGVERFDMNGWSRDSGPISRVREQRRVFLWAIVFFLIYLIFVSILFMLLESDWDFFMSFYFLFTSVALIGFGDVFPNNPNIVLINFAFIVLGIVLFGMCYFILQEEIREKAFQASRRVRNSIFKHHQRYRKRLSLGAQNGKFSSPDRSSKSPQKWKDFRKSSEPPELITKDLVKTAV